MSLQTDKPKVYVASSWRNPGQAGVVAALRSAGMDVYDFKEGEEAFHWSEVNPEWDQGHVTFPTLERMLTHNRARAGFTRDFHAMMNADTCVLVLPAGRSAHLEFGWMIGMNKRTVIFNMEETLADGCEPDLMVLMADYRTDDLMDLLSYLGVED